MASPKPTTKKPFVINPFEQLRELANDTARKVPEAIVNTLIPGPDLWKSPTPKPESMPGGPNFSPVDFDKLQKQYADQDSPDIDKIRQQLTGFQGAEDTATPQLSEEQQHMQRHKQFQREEEEYYLKRKQEEAEKERQEELEKQQKEQIEAEEAADAQQQEAPKGKVRKSVLGGGKQKANIDLPPEVRAERKGGAGKY